MLIQFIFDSKHFKFSTKTSEGKSRFDKETNLWGDKYRWELVLVGIASIFGRSFSISMLIRQFSGCGRHHHKTVGGGANLKCCPSEIEVRDKWKWCPVAAASLDHLALNAQVVGCRRRTKVSLLLLHSQLSVYLFTSVLVLVPRASPA